MESQEHQDRSAVLETVTIMARVQRDLLDHFHAPAAWLTLNDWHLIPAGRNIKISDGK
jgi:hypothetical protein